MRTLKKTLALVLVLSMMFSLCIPASAADFTDAEEIKYTEAVDVMTMIGVIEGMPGGTFDPTGTLTRAQAATILVRMLDAEDYAIATDNEFTDVAADHWAAGAISFCVEAGIVEGYGDGKFGPSDPLTGYQWAKMLLCALGYNAKAEGMTGAAWQINVAKLAKAEGLFAGNDKADKTVGATREEAALYAFNLLPATIVKYSGGSSVTVGDITFTSGGVLVDTNKAFMAEYFKNLSKNTTTLIADDFGRPGYTWVLKGKTAADNQYVWVGDEALATYEGTEWNSKVVEALVKDDYTINATAIYNGYNYAKEYTALYNKLGMTVELYADKNDVITIVAYEPYVAEITDISTAKTGKVTVTMSVYEAGAVISGAAQTVVINSEDDKAAYALVKDYAEKDLFIGYFAQGFEKSGEILAVDALESVSGKVTATSITGAYNGWAKVDGEQYYFANEYSQAELKTGYEGTFYLYNGLLVHFVATKAAAPQYAYVVAMDSETDNSLFGSGKTVVHAQLLLADGTVITVPTTETTETAMLDKVVTYKDGTGLDAGKTVLTDAKIAAGATAGFKGSVASQNGVTYNNKTVFVVETTDATTKKPVYTVYTGITNVPTYTAGTVYSVVDKGAAALTFVMDATLKTTAATSKDVVYVGAHGNAITEVINNKDVTYYVYNAIVNGEITTIKSTVDTLAGFYGAFTYDANGMVASGTALAGDKIAVIATKEAAAAAAKEGVLNTYIYNDATVVYVVDALGNITESVIGAIEATETFVGYTTDGILTMVVYDDIVE